MSLLNISKKKLVAGAVVPLAVLASGGLVWQSSYSAFSATTATPTNNWTAGTVALADDDSNTAMFNATNLKPGSTGNKCIVVTSSGTLASTVKLYGTSFSTTKSLADSLNIKVEEGTGGSFANCTGFTAGSTVYDGTAAAFAASKTDFASGVGTWAPAAGTVAKTYKVTYTLSPSTPDSAQGGTAALGFTWESQNS
jgi:camelysin-like metallo-endopeptidase